MTAHACTGRCDMSIEARVRGRLAAALMMVLCTTAGAAEPAPPPGAAQAAQHVIDPDGLRARLLRDEPSPVRGLDPAIFTELLPVSASEPAVRLPEDQREPGFDGKDGGS